MTWVEWVKECYEFTAFKRLEAATFALVSSASALFSSARAAVPGFFDDWPGRVVPMYGVPVSVTPPAVKYGPPPFPTATVWPADPGFGGLPPFDWGSMLPYWPSAGRLLPSFSAPDFSHLLPSFPKLFGLAASDIMSTLALVASVSLLFAAVCWWALDGGIWYLGAQRKK